jgi:hypothetical protein
MLYVVTIKGTMLPDRVKQFPQGLIPDVVKQVYTMEAENDKQISEAVAQWTNTIVAMQGMLIRDDPYHADDSKPSTARKWFPLHMIAFLSAEVEKIAMREGALIQ